MILLGKFTAFWLLASVARFDHGWHAYVAMAAAMALLVEMLWHEVRV